MQMSCLAEGALPGRGVIAKISSVVLIYASLERSKKLLFLELPAVIFETPIEDFSLYFCGLIFCITIYVYFSYGLVSDSHFRSPTQNLASVAQLRRPCPSAVAQVALMRDSVTCEVGGMEFDTNFRSRTVHVTQKCQCVVF